MHAELVVPGLFAGEGRHPAAELLVARGRSSPTARLDLEDWLAAAFGLEGALPAGALTALAAGLDPGEATWLRADPVHLRTGMHALTLFPATELDLTPQEGASLLAALQAHFKDDFRLHAAGPDAWVAQAKHGASVTAASPATLAGRDVDANLPKGPDAARWHAALNEAQMLLHDHPVNEARESSGTVPVNSVWFWGAGPLPKEASAPWRSVASNNPVAQGLARLSKTRAVAMPDAADAWLAQLPEEGRHLALLEEADLARLEERWFAPLLAALRAGRIGMVTLHVPDAGRSVETVKGDLRRFWRRTKALA